MLDTLKHKEMQELFHHLVESGRWDALQKELAGIFFDELTNAKTPEESFKVALMVQLVPRVIERIEQSMNL